MLYNFNEGLSVALSVQSASEIDVDGKLNSSLFTEVLEIPKSINVKTKWENPWKVSIGGLYKINQNLVMNLDASMNIYGKSDDILMHKIDDNSVINELINPDSIIGISGNRVETDFKNSFNIGIGFEYAASSELIYRFGYLFNQSVQQKSMYSHLFPGTDNHWLSAGIGISQNQFLIDVTLSYAFGQMSSENKGSTVFEGEYSNQLFLPSLTIKYNL
jgi:long-subunit fatty acid transport protein